MGQYFQLRNVSRTESVELPGPMKAIERVTNPAAMGLIGYLLFEGPIDGTGVGRTGLPAIDDTEFEQSIDAHIEREASRVAESEHREQSVYQNDDGSWQRDKVRRVVAAGYDISEGTEYAGRWAGDDVRLVGDYADNDLYSAPNPDWVYENRDTGEKFTQYATASAPIKEASLRRTDIHHSVVDRDVENGDLCQVTHPETGDQVYAYRVRVCDNEWTDITDGLLEEFASFVGEEWLESNGSGKLSPDHVINAD